MTRFITGVDYRHPILTAYLKVIAPGPNQAERRAKKVGTLLKRLLPKEATICAPRYKGFDPKKRVDIYEIPVLIGQCEAKARSVLAQLVLQGSPTLV